MKTWRKSLEVEGGVVEEKFFNAHDENAIFIIVNFSFVYSIIIVIKKDARTVLTRIYIWTFYVS